MNGWTTAVTAATAAGAAATSVSPAAT